VTKTASSSLTSATISQGLQATGKVQIDLVPRNKSDIEKLENPPRSGDNNGNLPWGPNNPSSVAGGGMLAFLADSLNFATVCPILLAVLILVFA
jgi:hypothetical protein